MGLNTAARWEASELSAVGSRRKRVREGPFDFNRNSTNAFCSGTHPETRKTHIPIEIMGKKKIDIKKINNKNYLKATFSKRRKGLFRKATDLCCLSGAQIAIITFSPGNKPFYFGHPSAETVIDRFLGEQGSCTTDVHDDEEGVGSVEGGSASLEESVENDEDHEDLKEKDVMEEKEEKADFWWEEEIDDEGLGVDELKTYRALLEGLKANVAGKLDEIKGREIFTKNYLGMNWGNSETGSNSHNS